MSITDDTAATIHKQYCNNGLDVHRNILNFVPFVVYTGVCRLVMSGVWTLDRCISHTASRLASQYVAIEIYNHDGRRLYTPLTRCRIQ